MAPGRLYNPANALTMSRFVLAPVALVFCELLQPPGHADFAPWVSIGLFVLLLLTMLTDYLDGVVARGYDVVTDFGKIMDPVADSTFFMTLLFGLSASPRLGEWFPIWIPVVVLWREVAMHVLRRYAALRGIVLAAKFSGKAKMVLQCVLTTLALGLLAISDYGLYPLSEDLLRHALFYSGVAILLANILSLPEYLREVPKFRKPPVEQTIGTR